MSPDRNKLVRSKQSSRKTEGSSEAQENSPNIPVCIQQTKWQGLPNLTPRIQISIVQRTIKLCCMKKLYSTTDIYIIGNIFNYRGYH